MDDLHRSADEPIPVVLFDRYVAGEVTTEEQSHAETWLAGASTRATLARLRNREQLPAEVVEIDSAWVRVAGRMRESETQRPNRQLARVSGRPFPIKRMLALFTTVAVVALMVFGVSSLPHLQYLHSPVDRVQRYATTNGQWSTVSLASGSTMILAPATSVVITRDVVHVTGEVHFTIAPHPDHPFVVQTRNAIVQVLGTTFGVRQYPTDDVSHVVVADGKVSIRAVHSRDLNHTSAILTARMGGRVTDSTVILKSDLSVDEYAGWTRGVLVFDREPLRDVVADLSRAYGIDIHIADSALAAHAMTMNVSVVRQSLTQILDLISVANQAHYTHAGNVFVLMPGRSTSHVPRSKQLPQPETQYGK